MNTPTEAPSNAPRLEPFERPALLRILGLVALFTLPFLGKAVNLDDTLFVWLAKHLTESPIDFFGFDVNWYGVLEPMHTVTKNPPGAGYLLALFGSLFGWSEVSLHLAMLVPAVLLGLGVYSLARRLTPQPELATLLGLATPAYAISATTLMSDVSMLALWVWSVRLWIRGLDDERSGPLWLSGLLAGLAGVTKYFGVALLPLLFAYGLARRRKPGAWLLPLLVPVACYVGYELFTASHYGRGLIFDAALFASSEGREQAGSPLDRIAIGLVFAGACAAPALLVAPFCWSRRTLAIGAVALVGVAAWTLLTEASGLGASTGRPVTTYRLLGFGPLTELSVGVLLQSAVWAFAGLGVIAVAAAELRRARDADALLLFLWVMGTLFFAAWINWVNNGRSNLPLAPAVGLILARWIGARQKAPLAAQAKALLLLPSIAIAFLAALGDVTWANQVRSSARKLVAEHTPPSGTLWFEGHWGFQYYMEEAGASALNQGVDVLRPGDRLVIPLNNVDFRPPPSDRTICEPLEALRVPQPAWIPWTSSRAVGISFYASNCGLLPFGFAAAEDRYWIGQVHQAFGLRPRER